MSILHILGVALGLLYAVGPYLAILLLVSSVRPNHRLPARHLPAAFLLALAAFCVTATAVTRFSFDAYCQLHPVLLLVAAVAALFCLVRQHSLGIFVSDRADRIILLILLLAWIVRFIPLCSVGASLGSGDAEFHNILAQKILVERRLAVTWEPFAAIRVMYPQGSHVLVAFVAQITGLPVHEAFLGILLLISGLTCSILYLLGLSVFGSRDSAIWAAAGYAFLPLWGSLDYLRWGGLPNALAMSLVCLFVTGTLSTNSTANRRGRTVSILAAAFCFPAILLIHHYTLIVAFLVLAAGALFTSDSVLRRHILKVGLVAALFCLPLMASHYTLFAAGIGKTGVLVFREPFISLWQCVRSMNPIFVAAVVAALWYARACPWNARQIFILAWMSVLLAAFVFLEYIYRAGALLVTGGQDCFTALTPSRMATDMVYPMSLLLGFIPKAPSWPRYNPLWNTGLWILSALTAVMLWSMQRTAGIYPFAQEAGDWIRTHTPQTTMLIGRFPHVEYLTWRETTVPYIPASEERGSPAVTWKQEFQQFDDWIDWSKRWNRPVLFLRRPGSGGPPSVALVFENPRVSIYAPMEVSAP